MFKHANTFFPRDRVTRVAHGAKLAGAGASGSVVSADDNGCLVVLFDDGSRDAVRPEELVKESE